MTPETRKEIIRLIKTTDMDCGSIGKRIGLSRTTITRCGVKAGIDMKQRAANAGLHKKRRHAAKSRLSHIPDSMTGDGFSLEWLKKEW
jgi:hypothetical protein